MDWKRKQGTKVIEINRESEVTYLTYPALTKCGSIVHGFSTRMGGVSTEHLSTMNLSFSRGDKEDSVRKNFKRMGKALGFDTGDLVFSDQTHTTTIRKVTEADRGKGFDKTRDYQDIDGLITNVPGLMLATFYADCVPLYFVDPVKKAIGLSHSGWKGTVGKIGKVTIEAMVKEYGSNPTDIITAIGPSICQDCYEVSTDVIDKFKENFSENLWCRLFYGKKNGKYQLNLWKANEEVLLEAGILKEHISTTDICTCCNHELLYSHRASNGMRGNLAAFLGMR